MSLKKGPGHGVCAGVCGKDQTPNAENISQTLSTFMAVTRIYIVSSKWDKMQPYILGKILGHLFPQLFPVKNTRQGTNSTPPLKRKKEKEEWLSHERAGTIISINVAPLDKFANIHAVGGGKRKGSNLVSNGGLAIKT